MKLELRLCQFPHSSYSEDCGEADQKPRKKQMTEKQKRKKLLQYKFPLRKRLALEFGSNKYTLTKESYWHPQKVAEMTNNGFTRKITMQPNGKILETLLTYKYEMLSSDGWGRIECQRTEKYDGAGNLVQKVYQIPQKRMVSFHTREYPFKRIIDANGNEDSVLKEEVAAKYRKMNGEEQINYLEKCTIDELCDGVRWYEVSPHKDGAKRRRGWIRKGYHSDYY